MKCGGCGQEVREFFTAHAWITLGEMTTRTEEEIRNGADMVVPFCTPHCLFDWSKAYFSREMGVSSKDNDLLVAVAYDLLDALDGFGAVDGTATDKEWQKLNDAHERLGIVLRQYAPPSFEEYLARG